MSHTMVMGILCLLNPEFAPQTYLCGAVLSMARQVSSRFPAKQKGGRQQGSCVRDRCVSWCLAKAAKAHKYLKQRGFNTGNKLHTFLGCGPRRVRDKDSSASSFTER